MMAGGEYEGMPLKHGLLRSRKEGAAGDFLLTKGTHYPLSSSRYYIVRLGRNPVVMPAMEFSLSAASAFDHLYGREGKDD